MTKHTPGPWKIGLTPSGSFVHAQRNGREADIATNLYDESNEPTMEELEANATLIAAAPEMLDVLENGEEIISGLEAQADNAGLDMTEARQWWLRAAAAIKKARGK